MFPESRSEFLDNMENWKVFGNFPLVLFYKRPRAKEQILLCESACQNLLGKSPGDQVGYKRLSFCLVPRPYYCARPMPFGSRGLSEFLRLGGG